ncbi:MAG: ATP-binding protein [Chloroflexota bacterium]|nr:HAMP domain-containing protein [Chloroflexota bacterium]
MKAKPKGKSKGSWFWRFTTLRWRLTAFYSALVLVLMLSLGLFVYSQLDSFLTVSVRARLQDRATLVRLGKPTPPDGSGRPNLREDLQQLSQRLTNEANTADIYARVLDARGQIVRFGHIEEITLPDFTPRLPSASELAQATGELGNAYFTTLSNSDQSSERGLIYLLPLANDGSNPRAYLLLAASLKQADVVLGQLRLLFGFGVVGALGLTLLMGLPLARLGLQPLQRVAQTATRIGQGELSQRVELPAHYTHNKIGKGTDEVWQLVQAFNRMLDQIEAAFLAQKRSEARTRQFVADASHELRSPLTVLGGYLDVLLMGAKDDPVKAQEIITSMRREIDRLSRLVIDLLTLTRLDAGKSIKLEAVSLAEVLDRAVANIIMLAGKRRVELLLPDPFVQIRGDSDQLYRAVFNLLDNAVRYTSPQGRIELKLALVEETVGIPSQVIISVKDNGSGITPEQLPHIFERFYRADRSRTRQTGNAGLGLAIVKGIIEAHSGEVAVTSQVGEGTCFSLTLPVLNQLTEQLPVEVRETSGKMLGK